MIDEFEDRIRDGFVHGRAGDLANCIGPTLDVLDVERRVHVDARVE